MNSRSNEGPITTWPSRNDGFLKKRVLHFSHQTIKTRHLEEWGLLQELHTVGRKGLKPGAPQGLVFQKEIYNLSEHLAEQTEAQTMMGPHLAQDCLALQNSSPLFKTKLHVRTSRDGLGGRAVTRSLCPFSQFGHNK